MTEASGVADQILPPVPKALTSTDHISRVA